MSICIGIDPGLTGAVANFEAGHMHVRDIPTVETGGGVVKREVCAPLLYNMLDAIACDSIECSVLVERTSSMPGQGVASTFSMGVTRGIILGVLGTMHIRYHQVAPATWKAHFGLLGKDKDMSRTRALELFPYLAADLARMMDHNRAEAVLLAEYLRLGMPGKVAAAARPKKRRVKVDDFPVVALP